MGIEMALLLMWIWSTVALAEPFLMNDVGGTLHLSADWKMTRWSDWDFKATTKDEAIRMRLWLSEYQTTIDDDAAKVWGADYVSRLEKEGAGNGSIAKSAVEAIEGRPTVWSQVDFQFGGGKGKKGIAQHAAFAGAGQVIHLRVISNARNMRRAEKQLHAMLEGFELAKAPAEQGTSAMSSESGFGATLPDGWRPPVEKEDRLVAKIIEKMWSGDQSECWVGMRPPVLGDPDVMFACKKYWNGGPVDAYSFDTVEAEFRTLFFGQAGAEIAKGEAIDVGDRMGALFRPRDGDNPIRMLVAPYDQGVMVVWARGASLAPVTMDTVMKEVAGSVTYTGPDGGHPKVRPDRMASYYVTHRPTHPIVWGPVLVLVGIIGFFVRRRKGHTPYADYDDITEM